MTVYLSHIFKKMSKITCQLRSEMKYDMPEIDSINVDKYVTYANSIFTISWLYHNRTFTITVLLHLHNIKYH